MEDFFMIKFYNSLTRKKEEITHDNGTVRMYSCGPTVYYYPHIGNFRAYLFMDNIRRVIKYNGFSING
ncbi:MAG: cysteine--tRNA ligase, partial [Clostridia bacterium]|nr:cysteine--tRNA ligase [Clostridia bacterium]